ncbi:MAG TPA: type IV toxin-antitoxin system AbiEi family antitoxin domain-containing protein [Micromonosporaceae bacterium]|nr:type IV toxin-antitoxin system AbiEi family antitoxin domain-containing protein [Micromonosporaceae bacterium]
MATSLDQLAAQQDGILTAAQCVAAGLNRADIARRCDVGSWRRVFRGAYFVDPVADVPLRARIRAALLTLGSHATATLTSGAYLHGFPVLPPDPMVQISTPAPLRRLDQNGLIVRQLVLDEDDVTLVDGMRVTSCVRTAADLVLALGRWDAVSMLDGSLRAGLLDLSDFPAVSSFIKGRRGAVQGRQRLTEADGRAGSPLETRIRLICVDAGLAPEELQYVIRDRTGQILAIADLAWPSRRLLVEADGAVVHGSPEALYWDRRRQNEVVARGYTVIRFTWADAMRPGYFVNAISRALQATARRLPTQTA